MFKNNLLHSYLQTSTLKTVTTSTASCCLDMPLVITKSTFGFHMLVTPGVSPQYRYVILYLIGLCNG